MTKRSYDVTVSATVLLAVFAVVIVAIMLTGCASMQKWLQPAAAATTQVTNNPAVKVGVDLIPFPYAREILEGVGILAAAIVGHYNGKSVAKKSAAAPA
jgi:hypothetical protein